MAVLSSSSSSLSDARKGTVARSSSSALMRPTIPSPWILQSIPELLHCLIAISMYLWYCGERNHLIYYLLLSISTTLFLMQKIRIRRLSLKPTNLSTVTEEKDSCVCGIDVNCLQLNQVVQRAATCILKKNKNQNMMQKLIPSGTSSCLYKRDCLMRKNTNVK